MDDEDLPRKLATDWRSVELDPADRAMLAYAEKLTLHPCEMEEGDVDDLRDVGFGDAAVLDICQVTSYYAFVNRMADGLGVQLEEGRREGGPGRPAD